MVYFVDVILKVLLVNLLAALNFSNIFLKIKQRLENKKNVTNVKSDQNKKRKKRILHLWFTSPPDGCETRGTKVCRYSWHSDGSLVWPRFHFPALKYKYIFRIKYTEAVSSDSTRKLMV